MFEKNARLILPVRIEADHPEQITQETYDMDLDISRALAALQTGTPTETPTASVYLAASGDTTGATDTSVIQAAVDDALLNHGTVQFDPGQTYYIDTAITIASPNGFWALIGNKCKIVQMTDGQPVFLLQSTQINQGANDFIIKGFRFYWRNNQNTTHTRAYGIAFESTVDNGFGFNNLIIDDIYLHNGYGVSGILSENVRTTVWNADFSHIDVGNLVAGEGFRFVCPTSGGMPNVSFRNVCFGYIVTGDKPSIHIMNANSLVLDNIEINDHNQVKLEMCTNVHIGVIRFEDGDGTVSTNNYGLIDIYNCDCVQIEQIHVYNVNFAVTGGWGYVFYCHNSSGEWEIKDILIAGCQVSSGNMAIVSSDNRPGKITGNIKNSDSLPLLCTNNTTRQMVSVSYGNPAGFTGYIGDADCTIDPTKKGRVIRYTSTTTANRTITLPTTSSSFVFDGLTYRVVKSGGDAFNVNVGGLKTLTNNQWCDIMFDGVSPSWKVVASGSL